VPVNISLTTARLTLLPIGVGLLELLLLDKLVDFRLVLCISRANQSPYSLKPGACNPPMGQGSVLHRATFRSHDMIVQILDGATMDSERAWTACAVTLSTLVFFGAIIVGIVGPM
jgi:hypothetical protein